MTKHFRLNLAWLLVGLTPLAALNAAELALRSWRVARPGQEHNVIKTFWPGFGCWFWTAPEAAPDSYERHELPADWDR